MSSIELGAPEARILGCMIEKQHTTPDAYPLSLNALRLACNQSTNRDPVVDYDETAIRMGLHKLERRGLVRLASGAGSRAAKYRHLLAAALPMDDAEQAVMCVLLLRGAQTPGELKQRTERMHRFASLEDAHATLEALIERDLVARHARQPGQKEDRYSHLLAAEEENSEPDHRERTYSGAGAVQAGGGMASGDVSVAAATDGAATPNGTTGAGDVGSGTVSDQDALAALAARIARLEAEVRELRAELAGAREG